MIIDDYGTDVERMSGIIQIIFLNEMWKTTINISQENQCHGQDMSREH